MNPAEPRAGLAQEERLEVFLCSLHTAEEAAWLGCLLLASAPGRLSRKLEQDEPNRFWAVKPPGWQLD